MVDEIAAFIARTRPHILCLQEVPVGHLWHKDPNGRPQDAAAMLRSKVLSTSWQMRHSEVQMYARAKLALMVLGRWKIENYTVRRHRRRARERSPVQGFRTRGFRRNHDFWVYNYHGDVRQAGWALLGLRRFIAQTLPQGATAAALGDFNLNNRPPSQYRRVQKLREDGFRNAGESGPRPMVTVNTQIGRPGGVDYIWVKSSRGPFYAAPWRVANARAAPEINDGVMVSDHLPVVARFATRRA